MKKRILRTKLWRPEQPSRFASGQALRHCSGQVVLEYAILVAVVAAAFITMSFYIKRAVQGSISMIESKGVVAKANSAPVYKQPNNW